MAFGLRMGHNPECGQWLPRFCQGEELKRFLCAMFVGMCCAFVFVNSAWAIDAETDGSAAGSHAAAAIRVPNEFRVELFAADPKLSNPVAICIDDQGHLYVAEDHRINEGTEENRTRSFLLDDDLRVETLEDRLAMFKKWEEKFDGGMSWFTRKSDIIRRLEDRDGDGKADVSKLFAKGFDGVLNGLGSGLIAREGKVWYTCIPHLWLLEDSNDDGVADIQKPLVTGFGVNAGFIGHDLHGLAWGPDGRLYFSVGDRGAHVTTKENTTISNPRTGAVYRCYPDGTELELIHRGLRNPQELAFDQFGNLFADDNNCDKGDHSRLVYVVPGGDSGWNMAFQSIPDPYLTGPWHAERMWYLNDDLQPAYLVPPVAKLGAGPSGFVFSSGTSLPARYENHFFYCNFTGNGSIESFAVRPNGASFDIIDLEDFCQSVRASDVDFGYDGKMYVAEYPVSPFDRSVRGGRIFTAFAGSELEKPAVEQTQQLFKQGFVHLSNEQLVELLHHHDMRVRQRAQFALTARDSAMGTFGKIARSDENQLARLHAIWGLGQIGRRQSGALQVVLELLQDQDSEVRAQALKVLGDAGFAPAAATCLTLLQDPSSRVRFFAALTLGSLKCDEAIPSIVEMLRTNDSRDRYLAHAGVVALERIGNRNAVQAFSHDTSATIRMAVLLVQRRWKDLRLVQFLNDSDEKVVTEAARAINDLPLEEGRTFLANLSERFRNVSGEGIVPLMRRIVNANYRLGQRVNIEAVIRIATSPHQTSTIRAECLSALANWKGPANRDRVTGYWYPTITRETSEIAEVVQDAASLLLATASEEFLTQVIDLFKKLDVKTDDATFVTWANDPQRPVSTRIAAIRLLASRNSADLANVIETALISDQAHVRAEARDLLAIRDSSRASTLFTQLLEETLATAFEKQRAIAALARLNTSIANETLDTWADRLRHDTVPVSLQLDLIEALESTPNSNRTGAVLEFRKLAEGSDPLGEYRVALSGGDSQVGRELFRGHARAQCVRCHSVDGQLGMAGPNLAKVFGPERNNDRRFLLESIVDPNAKIAPGFQAVTLLLDDGRVVAGTIKAEDETSVTIVDTRNETVSISRDSIEDQTKNISAMPLMTKVLTVREIRDLVEYLTTLK